MSQSSQLSLLDQEHVVLDDVSWDRYEQLLEEAANRSIRITYDNGRLEIMAPLNLHESWKKRIDKLIDVICEERRIKAIPDGSTTFRSRKIGKGLEPDEAYYIQHADEVRFKPTRDLSKDPPPDLAVEIDVTSSSVDRKPIYAALGIPELWRFDGTNLEVLRLDANGLYQRQESSGVFPFLPIKEFRKFLDRFNTEEHYEVVASFREWVRRLP